MGPSAAENRDNSKPPADAAGTEAAGAASTPPPEPPVFPPLKEKKAGGSGKIFAASSGNIIVTLSNEAFAAVVIVIILLLALAFAAGNWQGSRRGQAAQTPAPEPTKTPTVVISPKKGHDTGIVRKELARETASTKESREAKPAPRPAPKPAPAASAKPPEPTGPYWSLQVVSGINPNKAEELKIALEKQGYPNIVVKREGRYTAVRLGRFDSKDSAEATQFKKLVSEMKFEGRLQFQTCYFVKVE